MSLDLPSETRTIGGLAYTVQPLSARKSLQVMTRVLKMAAPGFGDVASLSAAAKAFGVFVSRAAEELDEETLFYLFDAFAEVSKVEIAPGKLLPLKSGDVAQWDDHFRGKMVELFEWLRFAAEVTFGPLGVAVTAKMEKHGVRLRFADPPEPSPAAG